MEVINGAAVSDVPNSLATRKIALLVIAHFFIAMAPATQGLVTLGQYSLPFIWAVSSVPFAQIMLLAMWIGLGQGKPLHKVVAAVLSVIYISFWHALGTRLLGGESRLVESVIRNCIIMLPLVAVLSVVMLGVRRWLGRIQYFSRPELLDASAQTRYSLFTALIVTTAGSFFMALFRISMERGESQASNTVVPEILLLVAAFSLLMVSAIWAACAPGGVRYRLMALSILTVLLGCSLAVSAGNTPALGGWWMFAGATLIVVVPATIVCVSLLYLRAAGYRLVRTPVASGTDEMA